MTALASPPKASGEQSGVPAAVVDVAAVDEVTAVVGARVVGATVGGAVGFATVVAGGVTVVAAEVVDGMPVVDDTEDSVDDVSSPQDTAATGSTATAATAAKYWRTTAVLHDPSREGADCRAGDVGDSG